MSEQHFSIDPQGAYVTRLVDQESTPILFERTEINDKRRGGSHVCLPNFGPDASGVLAQHGFGRTSEWQLTRDDDDVKELTMTPVEGEYANLQATLRYVYDNDNSQFTMTLVVANTGESPFRVAPGFHPYFAVGDEPVQLDGAQIDLTRYAGTEYATGPTRELRIGNRAIRLHSEQLTTWALWTDLAGEYFCVEPTLCGPSFSSSDTTPDEQLGAGEQRSYEFTISW